MGGHLFAEGRHFFGEAGPGFGAENRYPFLKNLDGYAVEARHVGSAQFLRQGDRRQARAMQDLV